MSLKLLPLVVAVLALTDEIDAIPRRRHVAPMVKTDRYGMEPMSFYDSLGEDYGAHDLLSEYSSSYGDEGDAYGGFGGGYGHGAPIYETEYSGGYGSYGGGGGGGGYGGALGGYGKKKRSRKPKIQFKKSYEMMPLYGSGKGKMYNVKVPNEDSPVKVLFLTQNTPVHIQQKHKKGKPEYKKATTHEEPHVVVHEVIKPVIQEIREIIVPYRKVIQKIEPVQEERKTVVHKDDGKTEEKYHGSSDYGKKYEKKEDDYGKYSSGGSSYGGSSYGGHSSDSYGGQSYGGLDLKYSGSGYDSKPEEKYGGTSERYFKIDHSYHGSSHNEDSYKKDRLGVQESSPKVMSTIDMANSQLLQSGGTINNGMTLASIFGAHPSLGPQEVEKSAKSS